MRHNGLSDSASDGDGAAADADADAKDKDALKDEDKHAVRVALTLAVESNTKLVITTSSTEHVRKPWNQYSMLSQGAREGAGSRTGVRQGACTCM